MEPLHRTGKQLGAKRSMTLCGVRSRWQKARGKGLRTAGGKLSQQMLWKLGESVERSRLTSCQTTEAFDQTTVTCLPHTTQATQIETFGSIESPFGHLFLCVLASPIALIAAEHFRRRAVSGSSCSQSYTLFTQQMSGRGGGKGRGKRDPQA